MLEFLINVASTFVLLTASLGANTMSTYFSYEPEMPECLIKSED